MRPRYLAAIAADPRLRAEVAERLASFPPLQLSFERGPLLLFASGVAQPVGRDGMLIGHLFGRGSGPLVVDDQLQQDVMRSAGQCLIEHGWGGYVALIVSDKLGPVSIVRSPLGDLPCYWWQSKGLFLAASDISALRAAGMVRPSIDAHALSRHMGVEDLRRPETCLHGIRELQGGHRLTVRGARVDTQTLWSPWSFTAADKEIADPCQAMNEVRRASLHAVACQARPFRSVLLKLSGGLDSSIVAACLAQTDIRVTCLNLVTEHPAGDERDYARAVAQHLDMPLAERLRALADVNVERSAAARLPRPSARSFTQASGALARELATEADAGAVFDGGGGDNVFCSLQSARPVADCLRRRTGRSFFWPTAISIASLAEVSLWPVVRRALAISLRRTSPYRWSIDTRFMSREAVRVAASDVTHEWLLCPGGTLPGKAAHVALVAAAQSVVEGSDVEDDLPEYSPLISQPVVECCLRVPSWLWFGNGENRFAARRAFGADLPQSVVRRRSKGAPDCFVVDVYEANRAKIRGLLLGGVLDREGLLDRRSIETTLHDEAPVQGHDFLRIMHLVDAEAWTRSWS